MKTNHTGVPHVILNAVKDLPGYRSMMRSFATLRMTWVLPLLLAACTADEPVDTATRTPLSIGTLHLTPTQTRATAEGFFMEGDELEIRVGVPTPLATTQWSGGRFGPLSTPIYLEDVWNPDDGQIVDITAYFGETNLVSDQTTEESLHAADCIIGFPTVDAPNKTLNCDAMWHAYTQLIIEITKGEGWKDDADFMSHFDAGTYSIHTVGSGSGDVYPYVTRPAGDTGITLTCLLPQPNVIKHKGAAILTLTVPDSGSPAATRSLLLSEDIAPDTGKSITITATYNKMGTFGGVKATLNEWVDVVQQGELGSVTEAFREAEKERFIAWATTTGADSWEQTGFTLKCDINLGGVDFTPIGFGGIYFTHTFDGGGHTISGLKINKPNDNLIGLFGYIAPGGGSVKNLAVTGDIIGKASTGGIAGVNWGTISGCTFSGTVTGTDMNTGGITGRNFGLVTGCRVRQSILTGYNIAGGIAGTNESPTTGIIACLAEGVTIKGTSTEDANLGGIAGSNAAPLVACVAAPVEMTSAGNPTSAGGITGRNFDNTTATACYWQTGTGYTTAIGSEYNFTPQEGNCTSFAPGAFPATAVTALNAAIEEWNKNHTGEECGFRWKDGMEIENEK